MKRFLTHLAIAAIFIFLPIALTSCEIGPQGEKKKSSDGSYTMLTIEGCEYIEVDYGFGDQRVYSLTHKGNCSNPIHKH